MSIRLKLLLSYLAMLVLPVFLTVIAAAVILAIQLGGLRFSHLGPGYMRTLTQNATAVYADIQNTAVSSPDKFLDTGYLDELDKKLSIINSGIVVTKEDKLIYASEFPDQEKILKAVQGYKLRSMGNREPIISGKTTYSILNRDLQFKDKESGTVFIITDIGPIGRFFYRYFTSLLYAGLLIMILVNGFLTFIVSRSILRPLKQLKYGTEQIKDGNLDFKMKSISRDEIGEVCTAFEKMREKLKESIELQIQYEDNRKELISNISHDLKTPITSIKGYIEGIIDGVADSPDKMDKYIKTIYSKASDMDKLIDDLFLFSKLDLKKQPFNFERVDIKEYFEDCIEELRLDFDKEHLQLEFETEYNEDLFVLADREKLKRVVMNIIDNAKKYMRKENGTIIIRLSEQPDTVTAQIRDDGQGINKEDLPNIFERFYRSDESRNSVKGGSGLGLAIAKQIIEGHGGRIWAESEENEGTSIFFLLKKV